MSIIRLRAWDTGREAASGPTLVATRNGIGMTQYQFSRMREKRLTWSISLLYDVQISDESRIIKQNVCTKTCKLNDLTEFMQRKKLEGRLELDVGAEFINQDIKILSTGWTAVART